MIRAMPEPGLVVDGRYRLDFPLGEGGFGMVWRATEVATGRPVALKFLRGGFDRADLARFEREVQALRRIDDPHCVALLAAGFSDELVGAYLVTEYLQGETLAAWAARPHDLSAVIEVGSQIASALAAAHRVGVVHRDLKPANVMVVPGENGPLVKVLDFGIARMVRGPEIDVTKTGEVLGTPGYMSPEQLRGERDIGPATDLYNLGVILWELIEGRPLFVGEGSLEIAMQHLLEPPPPLRATVPPRLAALVSALLEKAPDRRPTTALQVKRELDAIAGREVSSALPRRIEADQAQPSRATTGVVFGTALLGGALVAAAAVHVMNDSSPPAGAPIPAVAAPRFAPPAAKPVTRDPAIATPTPDAVEPDTRAATVPVVRSAGCGKAPPRTPRFGEGEIRLPADYDEDQPHALLVLFSEHGQTPAGILEEVALERFADAHRVVLFAPESDALGLTDMPWDQRRRLATLEQIAAIEGALCVDSNRVFLFGHGSGGIGAQNLPCDADRFAGVIVHAYRMWNSKTALDTERSGRADRACGWRGPTMALHAMDAVGLPKNGGAVCEKGGRWRIPLAAQNDIYARHNACDIRQSEPFFADDHGDCVQWSCAAPTVVCSIAGGPHFPGYVPEIVGGCDKPDGVPFAYDEVLRKFMLRAAPPPEPAESVEQWPVGPDAGEGRP